MPMRTNKIVQTGANIQLGGLNDGFIIPANHVGILDVVNNEPTKPADRGTPRETMNLKNVFIIIVARLQIAQPLRCFLQKRNETSIFYCELQRPTRSHHIYFLRHLHFLFHL